MPEMTGAAVTVDRMSTTSPARPCGIRAPSWAEALAPVEPTVARLGEFLRSEVAAGRGYLPGGPHAPRLRATVGCRAGPHRRSGPLPHSGARRRSPSPWGRTSDPSPRAWSTSSASCRPTSASPSRAPATSPLGRPGVLLLNRVLTVAPGKPASHRGKGGRRSPLGPSTPSWSGGGPSWPCSGAGRPGARAAPARHPVHRVRAPSPLSAHAGFFGSRPFSRANDLLARQGADPVDWRLP